MAWAIAKGKWGTYKGRVGIIWAVLPGAPADESLGVPATPPSVEFHLVKRDGTTDEIVFTEAANVGCPRADQIPASRCDDRALLLRLGYLP